VAHLSHPGRPLRGRGARDARRWRLAAGGRTTTAELPARAPCGLQHRLRRAPAFWEIILRRFRNISEPNQIVSPLGGAEKIYFSLSSSPYGRKLEHRPEARAAESLCRASNAICRAGYPGFYVIFLYQYEMNRRDARYTGLIWKHFAEG